MATQTVEVLVAGGKATAAPPLGPALGPLGVNIGQVVADINKKTAVFNGMQVPVKIIVDSDTKKFEISIGTPPASALILKEAGVEKGSGNPKTDKVADVVIEQIIKVAKMKESSLLGKSLKEKVKEIIELTAEEKAKLEEERKRLAEEMEKRRAEFEARAKDIIAQMAGKERGAIKAKLKEAGIPDIMIKELLPVEGVAGAEAAQAAPGAAAAEAKPSETPKKEEKKEAKEKK